MFHANWKLHRAFQNDKEVEGETLAGLSQTDCCTTNAR
jgi:hypothetical protein